jgi:small-conductance mechanosensitive channel
MDITAFIALFEKLGIDSSLISKILKSCITIFLIWSLRFVALRVGGRRIKNTHVLYRFQKSVGYVYYILLFVVVGTIWYTGIESLLTFFGLLSAGLVVALKDPLVDFVGWMYIFWKEPFKVGQRIQMGKAVGDIIDIGTFQLTLLEVGSHESAEQSTGRIIYIPNKKIFTEFQANYDISFPFIWHEIDVVVTFESNWKQARAIITEIINNNSLKYDDRTLSVLRRKSAIFLLPDFTLEPIVFLSVVDHGVCLSARYICEPRKRRSVEQKVWEKILDNFSTRKDIDFAYPTQRFYDNTREGKSTPVNESLIP